MRNLLLNPLLRLLPVGLLALSIQRVVFADTPVAGVKLQFVLALVVAAGAGGGSDRGAVAGFPGTKPLTNAELLALDCDLLAPAALENQITSVNAGDVRARFIAEAANGPTTPAADAILAGKGVTVPETLEEARAAIADVFQGPNLGVINGLVVTSFGLGGSFSPWLAGWVFDHTGSYVPAFLFALSAVVVSAVLIWVARPSSVRAA